MSFIFCLIARSKNVILTEFSEYVGNFQQIALEYLKRVKTDTQCSIAESQ